MPVGRHFPQFLEADAVGLRVDAVAQAVLFLELLAQMATTAFGEQRVFRMQFHAGLVCRAGLAVARDAHVAGRDTFHCAALVVENLGAGKARIDLDAQRLSLFAEPLDDVAETHDVVALIQETGRQQLIRNPAPAGFIQEDHLVFGDRGVQWRALRLPVRDQFGERARIHHRAREDVCADLGSLFDQAHRQFGAFLVGKLLEPDRRREPRRAAAYDQDIEFH